MKIQTAIIDDGVNEKNISVKLKNNIEVVNGRFRHRTSYNPIQVSHATTCSAIIKKYAIHNIFELTSIKILSIGIRGNIDDLCAAMIWCLHNHIKVVHLSIGTIDFHFRTRLMQIVNQMQKSGMVIVAASQNDGFLTYPASFMNVIGVRAMEEDPYINSKICFNENFMFDGIEFKAKADHTIVLNGKQIKTHSSNSFAAPFVTGIIINLLHINPELPLEAIKKILSHLVVDTEGFKPLPDIKKIDWINTCLVINCTTLDIDKTYIDANYVRYFIVSDLTNLTEEFKKELSESSYYDTAVIISDTASNHIRPNIDTIKSRAGSIMIIDIITKSLEKPFFNNRLNNSIQIPLLYIIDEQLGRLALILKKLSVFLYNKGYNNLSYLNNKIGLLYNIHFYENIYDITSEWVNKLATIQMKDIIMIGFHYTHTFIVETKIPADLIFHIGKHYLFTSESEKILDIEPTDIADDADYYTEQIINNIFNFLI